MDIPKFTIKDKDQAIDYLKKLGFNVNIQVNKEGNHYQVILNVTDKTGFIVIGTSINEVVKKFLNKQKNKSVLESLTKVINEAEDKGEAKYYFIVDANYSVPGYYYDNNIHAYTPEGDTYGSDPVETSKLYTWEELLYALDDEYLLTDEVPDEAPEEILKEENGHKILVQYEVEDEKEYDDDHGTELRYYHYDVQICIKE